LWEGDTRKEPDGPSKRSEPIRIRNFRINWMLNDLQHAGRDHYTCFIEKREFAWRMDQIIKKHHRLVGHVSQ
jgi:hypothetical protein